jgi:hypothetical protein
MTDPITISLAGIGAVALKEGVKFLYGQAAEILKSWRHRRAKDGSTAHGEPSSNPEEPKPMHVILPFVFNGNLRDTAVDYSILEQREGELRTAMRNLSDYVNDIEPPDDPITNKLTDIIALRALLEELYRQHITFKGENRPASGSALIGSVHAASIAGEAVGVEGTGALPNEARGRVEAERVEPGGKAVGVRWQSGGQR